MVGNAEVTPMRVTQKQLQSGMEGVSTQKNMKMGPFLASLRDWGSYRALSRCASSWAIFMRSLRELRSCSSDFGACPKEFSGQSGMEHRSTQNHENATADPSSLRSSG
jgi:hypothetical protein